MKKVMLSALVAGMFMIGSVYAQTTPAVTKPATQKESGSDVKTDKPNHKGHHKGKGKKAKKAHARGTRTTAPAEKK